MNTQTKKYLDNAKMHLFKTEGEDKFFKIFYEGDTIRKQYYDILDPHNNTDELKFDVSKWEKEYNNQTLAVLKHILFNPDKKHRSVKHFKTIRCSIEHAKKEKIILDKNE